MKNVLAIVLIFFVSSGVAVSAVNVNTATKEELMSLKGIGDVKAKAIIDFRSKNGPFKSMSDVDRVPGIGEGTIKAMGGDASLSGKTTVKSLIKKDGKANPTPPPNEPGKPGSTPGVKP